MILDQPVVPSTSLELTDNSQLVPPGKKPDTHPAIVEEIRFTAAWMCNDLQRDMYLIAKQNDTPTSQKIEINKFFARIGDVEPKAAAVVPPGTGFTIEINITHPRDKKVMMNEPIDVTPTYELMGDAKFAEAFNAA